MLRRTKRPPEPYRTRTIRVVGVRTSYVDEGSGPPTLLVHAGLGASTVWRRVIPALSTDGRVLAIDLIGTGGSSRMEPESDSSYGIGHLRTHLDSFLQIVGVDEPVTVVVLGLASMVVFDWAAAFPERVRAVCHMESVVEPWTTDTVPPQFAPLLAKARSAEGEAYVLFSDAHLNDAMRTQVMPPILPADRERYRMAYGLTHETRRAQLSLMRQVPVDGSPADTAAVVGRYGEWLATSDIPKLLIAGNPGYILQGELGKSARDLPDQQVVEVLGTHLLPEDSPDGVTRFLLSWLKRLGRS